MYSTYDSQSRLERSGLSISISHSNNPTKTHQIFILSFIFTKSFLTNPSSRGSVRIHAYLNKTHNQSRDKLNVEHPLTARTIEEVLVRVI